ncbi:hypothetical protein [Gynuella sp.]|uniref:hypothetical protein n=1 Tax=Gynuella sp. TaxID=2969146 RepID=UPI003D0DC657
MKNELENAWVKLRLKIDNNYRMDIPWHDKVFGAVVWNSLCLGFSSMSLMFDWLAGYYKTA